MKAKIKFSGHEIEQIFEQTHPDWKDSVNCIVCYHTPKEVKESIYGKGKALTYIGCCIRYPINLYVYRINDCSTNENSEPSDT